MSSKLRLGPLPKTEIIRLTIAIPAAVKTELDRYAELYGTTYGEVVDAAALVPFMLAAFMERDRAFRTARQPVRSPSDPNPVSTSAAISSTSKTAADGSSG